MNPAASEQALVLAPQGRDAAVAAAMLEEAGLAATACGSLLELVAQLDLGAGVVLVTEEAIVTSDLAPLSAWLDRQPEWSDLPVILLTRRGGGLERNPAAARYLHVLGNVTFLERPFHPTTLVSLAEAALRGRRRQYDARARLAALLASVTEQRRIEASLQELNAELSARVGQAVAARETALMHLHQAQKLETIGQLTGGVAHDFNNLLTPITGALDLLSRRIGPSDARSARLIGNALQSAERAKTLVQRLLGFARRQTLQTAPLDVAALLENMRDLIESSVGPAIAVAIEIGPATPIALADANQLELAVLNLCVNARDAMRDGGALTLAAGPAALAADNGWGAAAGDYVRLSVVDTGEGMSSETLARAVEPFYSTKGTGKGTGLGLSMVHGLTAQLGGAFVLTSAPGAGTRADLYLPVTAQAAPAPVADPPGPAMAAPGLEILLVDDEDLVRTSTADMLRELGHRVREASGGAQALALLADAASPDLIISDYMMPVMNGATLAERVRLMRPGQPVLIVTGYASGKLELAFPQLAKPFRQADLQTAVRKAVAPA